MDLSFFKFYFHGLYNAVINVSKIHTSWGNGRIPIQGIITELFVKYLTLSAQEVPYLPPEPKGFHPRRNNGLWNQKGLPLISHVTLDKLGAF